MARGVVLVSHDEPSLVVDEIWQVKETPRTTPSRAT